MTLIRFFTMVCFYLPEGISKSSGFLHSCGSLYFSLHEKYPYSEFTPYLSVFRPNVEKYGTEKLRKWTLFTQCLSLSNRFYSFSIPVVYDQ